MAIYTDLSTGIATQKASLLQAAIYLGGDHAPHDVFEIRTKSTREISTWYISTWYKGLVTVAHVKDGANA